MPTFRLEKLVKDAVYDSMLQLGQEPVVRVLSDQEFAAAIVRKIAEERSEYEAEPGVGEARDVQLVLQSALLAGVIDAQSAPELAGANSVALADAFSKRVFVDTITLSEKDQWTTYYRSDPNRFPEVSQ